jgi:hypothetical protein
MVMIAVRVVTGVLLLVHGLVHLLYLAPGVTEFSTGRSWLLTASARQPVALTLNASAVAAFALVALAAWGVPALPGIWPALTIAAGLTSMALLITFWDNALVIGLGIDAALVVIAVTRPAWANRLVT